MLRGLDDLGRAAAGAVEAAAASVHVDRVQGVCPSAVAAPPKGQVKKEKGVRKRIQG
jgi:hypothetical protein